MQSAQSISLHTSSAEVVEKIDCVIESLKQEEKKWLRRAALSELNDTKTVPCVRIMEDRSGRG